LQAESKNSPVPQIPVQFHRLSEQADGFALVSARSGQRSQPENRASHPESVASPRGYLAATLVKIDRFRELAAAHRECGQAVQSKSDGPSVRQRRREIERFSQYRFGALELVGV